jgi:hypothetical protein
VDSAEPLLLSCLFAGHYLLLHRPPNELFLGVDYAVLLVPKLIGKARFDENLEPSWRSLRSFVSFAAVDATADGGSRVGVRVLAAGKGGVAPAAAGGVATVRVLPAAHSQTVPQAAASPQQPALAPRSSAVSEQLSALQQQQLQQSTAGELAVFVIAVEPPV